MFGNTVGIETLPKADRPLMNLVQAGAGAATGWSIADNAQEGAGGILRTRG